MNEVPVVPNNTTFSLQSVVNVVGGTSLTAAITNSVDAHFDPTYKGSKNQLDDFRNYYKMRQTVNIGGQIWMKWNADNATSTSGVAYNNSDANGVAYGGLYAWSDIAYIASQYSGFHVPTRAEYITLQNNMGNGAYYLMEAGTTYWTNNNGLNSYGWSGRGGGYSADGTSFSGLKTYGYWWTATASGTNAYAMNLVNNVTTIDTATLQAKTLRFSLRLIKD